MEKNYCSACLKRCAVVMRDDSFDHEFGTQKVLTPAPACHPDDDLLTREEWGKEVQFQWNVRRESRRALQPVDETRIFREILSNFVKRSDYAPVS